jgi:hypothetical protein
VITKASEFGKEEEKEETIRDNAHSRTHTHTHTHLEGSEEVREEGALAGKREHPALNHSAVDVVVLNDGLLLQDLCAARRERGSGVEEKIRESVCVYVCVHESRIERGI